MLERAALGKPKASESDCLSSAETRLATRKKNWRLDGRKDQTVSATGSMIRLRPYYIYSSGVDFDPGRSSPPSRLSTVPDTRLET
jgi:hypothetical protein